MTPVPAPSHRRPALARARAAPTPPVAGLGAHQAAQVRAADEGGHQQVGGVEDERDEQPRLPQELRTEDAIRAAPVRARPARR